MDFKMSVPVTSLYAGLLAYMYLILTIRVTRNRHQKRIGILEGDDQEMAQAIRVHGNFSEYVPIILILMALSELNDLPPYFLHVMGIVVLGSRISHAIGLTQTTKGGKFRVYGMYATAFVLVIGGGVAIVWPYIG
jgi:uncharacterized membrane protein YecN with MAPEG domain